MTPAQIRKRFIGPTNFARCTGYTRMMLYIWERQKYIPKRAQQLLVTIPECDGLVVAPPFKASK